MGDCVELTTWPKHQFSFYKVTSSALSFEVKCMGNAVIGLAKNPSKVQYWICIDETDYANIRKTWISNNSNNYHNRVKTEVRNIQFLTFTEFRKFWLSWNHNGIQLGVHGETRPIFSATLESQDLSYVTFGPLENKNVVYWKLHLPPNLLKATLKPISSGKISWEQPREQLPDDSVVGGFENETLYIIRSNVRNSLSPGKFAPSEGVGYIAWGGEEHEVNNLEVLCGYDCQWIPTEKSEIPLNAIEAGYSEIGHEILYIGRGMHDGHLIPGKVQPSHGVCYIGYQGREIAKSKYEILVDPFRSCHSINKTFLNQAEPFDHEDDDDNEDDDENVAF